MFHSEPFILFKDKIVGVAHASLNTIILLTNNNKYAIPFDNNEILFQTDSESCHGLSIITLSRITKARMNDFYANVENDYKEDDVEILKFCQSRKYLQDMLGDDWGSKRVKSKKLNPSGDNMVSLKEYVEKIVFIVITINIKLWLQRLAILIRQGSLEIFLMMALFLFQKRVLPKMF